MKNLFILSAMVILANPSILLGQPRALETAQGYSTSVSQTAVKSKEVIGVALESGRVSSTGISATIGGRNGFLLGDLDQVEMMPNHYIVRVAVCKNSSEYDLGISGASNEATTKCYSNGGLKRIEMTTRTASTHSLSGIAAAALPSSSSGTSGFSSVSGAEATGTLSRSFSGVSTSATPISSFSTSSSTSFSR